MPDGNGRATAKAANAVDAAFADIPLLPAAAALKQSTNRTRSRVLFALAGLLMGAMLAAFLLRPTRGVDPNAPRVVVVVEGMHCPIQCGLRVATALESLPFVIPETVTANPKTGIVTFATTTADAVDQDQLRKAITKAGFGVKSVQLPAASPDLSNQNPQ